MNINRHRVGPFELRVWEGGSGTPVLFLHGLERHPGDAPFLQRLAEKYEVRAPEFPGYGESTGFDTIHDLQDVTLALRSLVESWGWVQIDVIGHSFGGMVAAEFAASSPHLVKNLVLVNSFGLWNDEHQVADAFAMTAADLDSAKWHDVAAKSSETNVAEKGLPAALERTVNLGSATKFLWPIPDRGLSRRLPYITARTLIVHGESDGIVPVELAKALVEGISGAELALISKAGHLPMFEKEEEFGNVVERFLAQERTQGA